MQEAVNKYTLKFNDQQLEQEFYLQHLPQLRSQISFAFKIMAINCMLAGISWIRYHSLVIGICLIILPIPISVCHYVILTKRMFNSYIEHFILLIGFCGSLFQLLMFIYPYLKSNLWINDLTLQMSLCFLGTSNAWLNYIQQLIFFIIRFCVRIDEGFELLSLCSLFYIFMNIYNDFNRVWNMRQKFYFRVLNEQKNDIFNEVITENIVIIKFNQNSFKFENVFQNQSYLENISIDPLEFLKSHFTQKEQNILQHIYTLISKQNKSHTISIKPIRKQHQPRFEFKGIIQYLQDTIIVIRIKKTIIKENHHFYKLAYLGLVNQLKKKHQKIYKNESIKIILSHLLYSPSKLTFKFTNLNQKMLIKIFKQYKIPILFTSHIQNITTLLPYFETLLQILNFKYSITLMKINHIIIDGSVGLNFSIFAEQKNIERRKQQIHNFFPKFLQVITKQLAIINFIETKEGINFVLLDQSQFSTYLGQSGLTKSIMNS